MTSTIDTTVESLPGGAILTTVRGELPGATIALLGGVHGDEDEGVLAVGRVLHSLGEVPLTGVVKVVSPANPSAWAAATRASPLDGGNLARCFPGDPSDGPTAAIAASITTRVIDGADLLVDLHSAGRAYTAALLCGFNSGHPTAADASRAAALAFGAPVVWEHTDYYPGRSISAAFDRGIPAIYAECGGRGAIDALELDAYVNGVLGVMHHLGMLPDHVAHPPERRQRWWIGGGDFDQGITAPHHGFFVPSIAPGAEVTTGEEIGRLYGFDGAVLHTVTAPRPGPVAFLRHQARVARDDTLFVMADSARDA